MYSHKSDIKDEHYSSADDEWTWTRDVIFNGEEITLTEKGSSISVLEDMDQNVWYEITYKANGTVKDAKYAYYTEDGKLIGATPSDSSTTPKGPALTPTTGIAAGAAGSFVDKIEWLENAINNSDKSTVLYEEVWGKLTDANSTENVDASSTAKAKMTVAPSLKESTLYVDTVASKGFYVSKDVKSVLIQKNDGKSNTEWGNGTADLENMLEDLNYDATKGYQFKISAILTNGRATTVIIHDWNETNATPDGSHDGGDGDDSNVTITGNNVTYTVPAGEPVPSAKKVRDDVLAALGEEWDPTNNGNKDSFVSGSGGVHYVLTVGGISYNITIDNSANTPFAVKLGAGVTAYAQKSATTAIAGESVSYVVEQVAAANLALGATVNVTGTPAGTTFNASVTKAGVTGAAATYKAATVTDEADFNARKAAGTLFKDNTGTALDAGDTYDSTGATTYYEIDTAAVPAVKGEITITFTMPGGAVEITGITTP